MKSRIFFKNKKAISEHFFRDKTSRNWRSGQQANGTKDFRIPVINFEKIDPVL